MKRLLTGLVALTLLLASSGVAFAADKCATQLKTISKLEKEIDRLDKTYERYAGNLDKNEDRRAAAIQRYEENLAKYVARVEEVRATNQFKIDQLQSEFPLCFASCSLSVLDRDCKKLCRQRTTNAKLLNAAIRRHDAYKGRLASLNKSYDRKDVSIRRAIERTQNRLNIKHTALDNAQAALNTCRGDTI